jgi:hypothetical protein
MPQRLEENPNSAVLISFHTFYRNYRFSITEYNDNLRQSLEKIKPLADSLRPPLPNPNVRQMNEISGFFPPSITVIAYNSVFTQSLKYFKNELRI